MNLTRWQRPEVSPWSSFDRLSSIRDQLDRLFEAPFAELARTSHLLSGWTPALDIHEDNDNLIVKVDVPGMKKEDIDVSLHDDTLSISGERKAEEKHQEGEVCRSERFFGRFQRTLTLPSAVAANKIKAQYQDGILTITLPKAEEAKPRKIDVQVN